MDYLIEHDYPAKVWFEISVSVNGNSYLVIYGTHVNGGFCCIPNWGVGCEMREPSDTLYNAESLRRCNVGKAKAKAIAAAIRDVAQKIDRLKGGDHMEKSPYDCTYYGKNLAELTDSEMMDCPGPGCVTCECCIDDPDAET